MTIARSDIVKQGDDYAYHCYSRCVRRAFLCGFDKLTGRNFDHRKIWVRNRIKELSKIFAIEVIAFAIMANHLHSILRPKFSTALQWSDQEVARRWRLLYPMRRDASGAACEPSELEIEAICCNKIRVEQLRKRLSSLSWFMRCLNENIARRANAEDQCTGHFWEGRFKSQRLSDAAAILSCMVYVDLNPIRASIARTPEQSDFTSIQERIVSYKTGNKLDDWLVRIPDCFNSSLTVVEYMELVDETGRAIKDGKSGHIPEHLEPILERLGINSEQWLDTTKHFDKRFCRVVGCYKRLLEAAIEIQQRWLKGMNSCKKAFS